MRNSVNEKRSHKALAATLISILVLAVVAGAAYLAWKIQTQPERETPINDSPAAEAMNFSLDPGISYSHGVTEEKLFFYSAENIKIANKEGELEQDFSLPLSQPFMSVSGRYALIADKGGRKAYLFRGSRQETVFELAESIISASVNEGGSCVFVTKGETHKCTVSVLDAKGNEKFRWNSGGLYVLDADISDNGKDIAVSALNTDGGILASNIILFNVDKETPFANDAYQDELFAAVRFNGSLLYAIGESSAYIYNGYGKVTGTVDYLERELLSYNTDGETLALFFSGSGLSIGSGDLETYNTKGERLGQFHCAQEVSYLDARGGRIALGSGRVVSILNTKCKEEFQISIGMDLLDFMFFGGEARAVGISAADALMVRVSKG